MHTAIPISATPAIDRAFTCVERLAVIRSFRLRKRQGRQQYDFGSRDSKRAFQHDSSFLLNERRMANKRIDGYTENFSGFRLVGGMGRRPELHEDDLIAEWTFHRAGNLPLGLARQYAKCRQPPRTRRGPASSIVRCTCRISRLSPISRRCQSSPCANGVIQRPGGRIGEIGYGFRVRAMKTP